MPDFRLKFHDWRTKRIVCGYFDVDFVYTAFIWCARRSGEGPAKMCDVLLPANWLGVDLGLCVGMNVGKLLANSSHAIACHDVERIGRDVIGTVWRSVAIWDLRKEGK